jgi:LysM repeat protein
VRHIIFLLLIAILLSACNLASNATTTPEVVPSQPAEGDSDGVLPAGTSAPVTTSETGTCVPRGDWPLYVVVAGDNLSDIAARAGSTVDELVAANCLDDPDTLAVGQELRVPRP